MSTLNNYIIFQCDVCKRRTEILTDVKHGDPVRCNITNLCRGKLTRVGTSAAKTFLFNVPVEGLQDYVSRGTIITPASSIAEESYVSLNTAGAGEGMLAAAILREEVILGNLYRYSVLDSTGTPVILAEQPVTHPYPPNTILTLKLQPITADIFQYQKFTFSVSNAVDIIFGPDHTPNANNLRFTASNLVRIFLNGVELPASAFDRTINDKITFTPTIYEFNNIVDILVYNQTVATVSDLVNLSFSPLDPVITENIGIRTTGAWGNCLTVRVDEPVNRYLMFCVNLEELTPNKNYLVRAIEIKNTALTVNVLPSELKLLFANSPFTFKDKEFYACVSGSTLFESVTTLAFSQNTITGIYEMVINESSLTHLLKPIITQALIDEIALAPTELISNEPISHKYIKGPT